MTNTNDSVCKILQLNDNFIYKPNGGNLGDLVIACAEFQVFDKLHLNYTVTTENNKHKLISNPYTLIFGGGGGWVPYWNYKYAFNYYVKNKNLKKCIILPSSFYKCDDVVKYFDERFIVFCRDKCSYEYCKSINTKSKFILHDDMAFSLDTSLLNMNLTLENIQLEKIKSAYIKIQMFHKSCKTYDIGNFIRTDKEKTNIKIPFNNFELSLIYGCKGEMITKPIATRCAELMIYGLQPFKKIITNRLHIGITASIINKNIELYDNSYHKLKNVYELSMSHKNNILFHS